MKCIVATVGLLSCFGLVAAAFAQDHTYFEKQADVLKCSPPKFLLVSNVDMEEKLLTGMSTIERQAPQSVVSAYGMTLSFSDIKVTDARRAAVDEADLSKLKGRLVILYDGKEPLSAAYMRLFSEDTVVISVVPTKK